jgi:hypothetical protein
MGTPHRGSDLASWGKILAVIAKAAVLHPTKNIKDLENNSSTLMDVSEDFRSIVGKYYIVNFYEDTKIKGISKEVPQSLILTYQFSNSLDCRLSESIPP